MRFVISLLLSVTSATAGIPLTRTARHAAGRLSSAPPNMRLTTPGLHSSRLPKRMPIPVRASQLGSGDWSVRRALSADLSVFMTEGLAVRQSAAR